MTAVHVIVPDGTDDPARPSGGNTFDRRICSGLADAGWAVQVAAVPGSWPLPDASSLAALARAVDRIPDGAVALVDGLLASPAPEVLVPEASRLRLVVLVHMPLGLGPAGDDVRKREAAVLSAAAAVITTSAWTRNAVLDLYSLPGDRVHVAEPGVDAAELARGTASAGALLSVAAVTRTKGHDVLLDALATLNGLPWHCVCVGSLEREQAFAAGVRRRALEQGLGRRVRFPGALPESDLACCYGEADVLVLPSRAETYGMVVTEALARGLPVVAADVGGVQEAMGHGADGTRPGLLVPPDDAVALGAALGSWLVDGELRRRLRRAARERRASLSRWSKTTAVVADVLEGAA